MDPSVQKIIDSAKRYAIAADAQVLGFDEILVALAVLRDDKTVVEGVAKALGVKTVKWPAELLTKAEVAVVVDETQVQARQFTLEPLFKDVFNALRRGVGTVKLEAFLNAVLVSPEARECPAVQEFLDSHQAQSKKKRIGLLGKLDDIERKRSRLEALLADKVVGQGEAVRMLGESYAQMLREPRRQGLQGIFTFVGPPGMGKTFLAEEFAGALNACQDRNKGTYDAQLFSLDASDEEGTMLQLFGTPSHYGNAKHGQLYDAINENPNRVLIFDEIEKAGDKLIQSLLTLLNKGGFNDRFKNQWVNASQCYVIFTTNLGQEFFSAPNSSGILRGGRFSSEQLFDLLASAKRREHAKFDQAPAALSPEFVDRLRQGAAILFNRLTITDYKQLMRKNFFAPPDNAVLLPQVRISEEAGSLLILSLLPDLSARRLTAETRRLKHRWTDEVRRSKMPELEKLAPENFTLSVDVRLAHESQKERDKLFALKTLKVLVIDNDERMTNFIARYVKSHLSQRQVQVERVVDPLKSIDEIAKFRPDLVLLDLDLGAEQLTGGGVLALQRQIRETFSSLPLWVFSESRGEEFDELSDLVDQGGARGYFAFQQDAQDLSIIEEDQQKRFDQLLQEVVYHRIMMDLVRSRSKLRLDYDFVDCDPRDAEATVRVDITKITKEQHVSIAISGDQIMPAEIPKVTFEDVYGLKRAKERLKAAVDMLKDPTPLAGFGVAAPSGYLLAGPSGTGKTHLARAVANAADCLFYSLSCGELESKFIGESEERIRRLFQEARQYAPAVIFIDEIDAIATRRDSIGSSHSLKLLNQLLTCMDGFAEAKGQILVLAATNRPEALDPAITRAGRFDETIPIDLPKGKAREEMLEVLLAKKPCESNVKDAIPRLVPRTARLSPAQIDRVIREAVYLAVRNKRDKISINDLETAANFVQYGAEKRDITINDDDRRRTAWHEAGHAVANHALFPEQELDLLTIVPNEEGALGFAAYADDESRTNWSADDFRKQIIICLAGREAERLCDGAGSDAVNTGVSSDYRQATRMAWDFVARYGFDEKFGVFSVSGVPEQIQSALADPIHARVNDLLSACLEDCRRLMEANRECLRKLADVLLDKQFIYGEEVRKIVDQHLKPVAAS